MRVVALVPGGIGDQIFLFPTLDDWKRYYPNAQLDVVVEPRSKAAYRVSKSVNDVLTFDYRDRNSLADWMNFVGMIRDREYDVVISVGQTWLMGLLLWLTGIPIRIGYQGPGAVFLTNSVPYQPNQYVAAVYHELLQAFGIKTPCPELAVNIPKSDIEWSQNEQNRLGVNETGYILVNTGSSEISQPGSDQLYPVNNWQQIIQECQNKQPDLPVVVIQGSENQQFGRSLLERIPTIKVTFPNNVGKLAAMIGGASLMLSPDDPLLHLSVAVQTYTIALFGPTSPAQLLPRSDKFLAIKSPTGVIADISPDLVLEKIWGG
ncbi:glycosyltransferase family 9 protein [Umezakia ovalisporum]|jgi:ADP-heptose:LPS heptosyltransferase|uniref:Glycosyltransferase family 9 protein n=2 Tax=Umezakia ovalisporum TaxID=75695 RepID=A0AA43H0Q3_9CYAN|nr:glycosyltransferase family 9 protein [Umezakia ovalisporum]MBI1241940.1 lipopolysaccharide heptosyltransferase family protein [Nostoc sp. RI_552]MDH6058518.1 glycosyltransferase family 9 protein [Umezakia ovalisporum FSS-43]MDH6064996.1 glycosyltransferase family 9 protein [Umezakia ovalisporum FSS-62]MDH6067627.1 glycosyltransferase family 9 protein [Umezakia ovalisporum APH033B]MDH6069441.1 glycosyltransferase family 9 protein [Umezakia ovalisporum CobakiLakeA]